METLRVLICDDEAGMRSGVARALRDYRFTMADIGETVGFAVEPAESGEQALEMIRGQQPDILLLDHKLPGISGLEVLEQLGHTEGLVTVMITAYASLETAVTAIKQGAYDFLAKPFTPGELKSTLRKAAESLIMTRQARKLALERRQVRFEFIRVLAHELKSPLAAIEGYLQIMKNHSAGNDPAAYERMVERCLVRSQGMRKMVMDLLDLTHIESGQKRRELRDLDLRELAVKAIETVGPDAASRGIVVNLESSEAVPMVADAGEMEIILNNLVSNAVKYNKDGGRVDVRLTSDATTVTLAVSDTGIGMAAEDSARLFEEFVRIKNEKTRNILGSGLGLSIVRKLARLYGGEARVESQVGVGSTFTVTLSRDGTVEAAPAAVMDDDA